MGQNQAQPAGERRVAEQPQYTAYSVPKEQVPQSERIGSQQSSSGGITVVSLPSAPQVVGGDDLADPELASLKSLPTFGPILRSSLAGSVLTRTVEAGQMDPTAFLLICRDFQEYLKTCAVTVVKTQTELGRSVYDAEKSCGLVLAQHASQAEEVRSLMAGLVTISKVQQSINAERRKVEYAEAVLRKLDAAITAVETEIETAGLGGLAAGAASNGGQ